MPVMSGRSVRGRKLDVNKNNIAPRKKAVVEYENVRAMVCVRGSGCTCLVGFTGIKYHRRSWDGPRAGGYPLLGVNVAVAIPYEKEKHGAAERVLVARSANDVAGADHAVPAHIHVGQVPVSGDVPTVVDDYHGVVACNRHHIIYDAIMHHPDRGLRLGRNLDPVIGNGRPENRVNLVPEPYTDDPFFHGPGKLAPA